MARNSSAEVADPEDQRALRTVHSEALIVVSVSMIRLPDEL
jgi:hypothetical protein